MQQRKINPWKWQDKHAFSQAIEVSGSSRVLYCAGQASVDESGSPVHVGDMRKQIEQGSLTAGHARALVATESPAELADQIIKLGLSVREAEGLARTGGPVRKAKAKAEKDPDTRALEKLVSEAIGLKVEITHRGEGGAVLISYSTLDQLEDICRRLQS